MGVTGTGETLLPALRATTTAGGISPLLGATGPESGRPARVAGALQGGRMSAPDVRELVGGTQGVPARGGQGQGEWCPAPIGLIQGGGWCPVRQEGAGQPAHARVIQDGTCAPSPLGRDDSLNVNAIPAQGALAAPRGGTALASEE